MTSPQNVLTGASTRISGANSYVVLDFGKEVGGIVSLSFAGASGSRSAVSAWRSPNRPSTSARTATSATAPPTATGTDGAIYATVNGAGTYTMPGDKLRGGFRYLTVLLNSAGWVDFDRRLAGDSPPRRR